MYQIKFGTDGWREVIADNFTTENVKKVAQATAEWLIKTQAQPLAIVGHDCRFGGEMFAANVAQVLASHGIKVKLAKGIVSTPMVSLGCAKENAQAGIIITASHNPPNYNGYKVKASYGGPAVPAVIEEIEGLIPKEFNFPLKPISELTQAGLISDIDLETMYINHVKANFDMPLLESMQEGLVYDAMFGAGQNVIKKLFPKASLLHCENNPGFNGRAPEPILKNLPEITEVIASDSKYKCGLATDGDADRIGFFDEHGKFVDSHHLILLLIKYLTEHKGLSGSVVKSFSVSDKVGKLCALKNLECITTKIGFKYICELMVEGDVLIGAEESGGIAIKGHIPERDGIWIGLVMMEYMAKTGKTVSQLIEDVYVETGSFAVERYDLHITDQQKQQVIDNCKNNAFSAFGNYAIQGLETIDGYKFRLENEAWVMIRPSGTEPVLRVYAESSSSAAAYQILDACKATILN